MVAPADRRRRPTHRQIVRGFSGKHELAVEKKRILHPSIGQPRGHDCGIAILVEVTIPSVCMITTKIVNDNAMLQQTLEEVKHDFELSIKCNSMALDEPRVAIER